MAAELEEELQAQLTEQQEAVQGVQQLLAADPSSEEMAELLSDLQAGIAETESALLGLKRQRLLAEIDALHGAADDQRQQQQQQQQAGGGDSGGGSLPGLEPGSLCIFRYMDGRHYFGRVMSCGGGEGAAGQLQLQFVHPTKAFQLKPLALPAASCRPGPSSSLHPPASALHPGVRLLVQVPGRQLWEGAEVVEVHAAGQRVAAVTIQDRQRHVLPLSAVVLSAHAPDPYGGAEGGAPEERRGGSLAGGGGWGSEDEAEEGGSDGSIGSGSEEEEDDDDGSNGEEDEEREGYREEAAEGFGAAAFGRVSLAMAEAAGLLQQQAAAGPQSCTNLFFGSEAHSRGIGSKLMASMGFKAGGGLGKHQQGMQQALHAAPMKRGAGLGVDGGGGTKEGSKKKRRSGKQRRAAKAAQEGREGREAARQAQQQLEQQTGSVGLFAVLNSIVGDASQAQAVKEANLGMPGGQGDGGRHAHLFGGGSSSGNAKKPAPKEEDRRALAKRADNLVVLQQKVQRLSEMAGRNARDKVMLPQIKRALAEAQAALAAAQRDHSASHKAIHDREKLKKMAKF